MSHEPRTSNASRLDDDLSALSPEDLRRVKLYLEDRLINAITPLDVRLHMQMPGVLAADIVYQEARRAVAKVMAVVEEVRAVSREPRAAETDQPARSYTACLHCGDAGLEGVCPHHPSTGMLTVRRAT